MCVRVGQYGLMVRAERRVTPSVRKTVVPTLRRAYIEAWVDPCCLAGDMVDKERPSGPGKVGCPAIGHGVVTERLITPVWGRFPGPKSQWREACVKGRTCPNLMRVERLLQPHARLPGCPGAQLA